MPKKTQRRVRPTPERAAEIYGRLHEHYPDAQPYRDYVERYNTRVVSKTLGELAAR